MRMITICAIPSSQPTKRIPAGYQPIMPSFQGLVTEDQIIALIAYIKSTSKTETSSPTEDNETQ